MLKRVVRHGIGDVERVTGVKAHVIRYWESEIPLLKPEKDRFGRRVYAASDIELLLRIKHLLYERKYTVEGAREELFREADSPKPDERALLKEVKADLLKLMLSLGKPRETP